MKALAFFNVSAYKYVIGANLEEKMRTELPFFAIALLLFAAFSVNIFLGAARIPVFLGDVAEMLALFGACVFFVIAVLRLENRGGAAGQSITRKGGDTK